MKYVHAFSDEIFCDDLDILYYEACDKSYIKKI